MFAFGDSSRKLRVRGNQRQYDLPQYRPTYRRSDVYQVHAGKLYMDPGDVTKPGGSGGNQLEGIPEGSGYGNQTPPAYTAPVPSTYTPVTGDRAIKTPTQTPAPQVIPSTNVDTTPVVTAPVPSVYTPVTGVRAVKTPTLTLYTPNTRGKY